MVFGYPYFCLSAWLGVYFLYLSVLPWDGVAIGRAACKREAILVICWSVDVQAIRRVRYLHPVGADLGSELFHATATVKPSPIQLYLDQSALLKVLRLFRYGAAGTKSGCSGLR